MRLCALLAILFIIKVTSGQLEERCPSCCHHSFNETSITETKVRPSAFWDCTADEKSAINAARCISECAYNVSVAMFRSSCSSTIVGLSCIHYTAEHNKCKVK